MKVILLIMITFSFFYTSCSSKPQPTVCKVVIPKPTKAELEKFKKENKSWQKQK